MEDQATFRITPRLIFGVCVLTFGGLLLLDQLNVLDARDYLEYWPAALIVLGLTKLVQTGARGGGIVLTVLGTALLLSNLGYLVLDFDLFFPALLVLGGVSLIFGEIFRRARRKPGESVSASSEIDPFAILGSVKRVSSSQAFRGGSATALLGAAEIDLRQARIQGGEAVIDTFAFWGGIEIFVPEDWEVVQRGVPILGGFEDLTRPPLGGSQRLVIKGMAIMGGVEIRNWKKEEQDVRRLLRDEPVRRDETTPSAER